MRLFGMGPCPQYYPQQRNGEHACRVRLPDAKDKAHDVHGRLAVMAKCEPGELSRYSWKAMWPQLPRRAAL